MIDEIEAVIDDDHQSKENCLIDLITSSEPTIPDIVEILTPLPNPRAVALLCLMVTMRCY